MVAHFIKSDHLGRNGENSLLNRECEEMFLIIFAWTILG